MTKVKLVMPAFAAVGVLVLVSCRAPGLGYGGAYRVDEGPWQAPPAAASQTPMQAPAAEPMATAAEDGTVLERLQETAEKLQESEAGREQLRADVASLTHQVEQLRADNEALQELANSLQADRGDAQGAMAGLQNQVQDVEMRYRELVDELLGERIQRVRVERELILARIAEARRAEDG